MNTISCESGYGKSNQMLMHITLNAFAVVRCDRMFLSIFSSTRTNTWIQSWYDAITKAKHIYSRLKQGSPWDGYNIKYYSNNNSNEMLGVRKSPLNSSIGSRLSSLNNSHRWFDYYPCPNVIYLFYYFRLFFLWLIAYAPMCDDIIIICILGRMNVEVKHQHCGLLYVLKLSTSGIEGNRLL